MHRREFLKMAVLLAGATGGKWLRPGETEASGEKIEIAVVEGRNPAGQVREAIRLLGGIQRFIRRGDRVVLLPNPQGIGRGVTPNPDMVAETVRLCLSAGAFSVSVSSCHEKARWVGTGIIEKVEASGGTDEISGFGPRLGNHPHSQGPGPERGEGDPGGPGG